MHNSTMKEAFKKASKSSETGRKIYFEATKNHRKVGERIHQLKSMAHDTFVKFAPRTVPPGYGWNMYTKAKPEIRKLGIEGGEVYENALNALKFAWVSFENHQDALKALNISQ